MPPRNSSVSQAFMMVLALFSPYDSSSWERDCRIIETAMLRLRVTVIMRSKSGMVPMFANSSNMKWTHLGRRPEKRESAVSQSESSDCCMRSANTKSKVESVSDIEQKSATLRCASPMWSSSISS